MKVKSLTIGTTLALAALSASSALAYEAGDIIVRAGLALVDPDESSDGIAVPVLDVGPIAGTGVEVGDDTQLGLTATYMLSSSLGVELLAATPFTHDITADLSAAGFGKVDVGETTHLPPTLSVVWYPYGTDFMVKPYIGAGVNYTIFFEEDVSSELEAAAPAVVEALGGPTLTGPVPLGLELDDSWGLAAQIGVDIAINDNWHINGAVRWIDIDTEAEISSALSDQTITVDNVEIDPFVYQLTVGYKF